MGLIILTKTSSQTIQGEEIMIELDDFFIEDSNPLDLLDDLVIDLGYEGHILKKIMRSSSKRKK